ncbi:ABC transporter ATP-binding protein [Vagococcus sp. JNUCC 83]
MLKTKDIGYWYTNEQDFLYKHVDLDFKAGNIYAILGASGSGKTTFLSLIAGLDVPKEGIIYYNDTDIHSIGLRNYRKNDVSTIFQSYNLLPYMSALDNVLTAMSICQTKVDNKKEYALEHLNKVGIDDTLAVKPVTQLSGGQQQRVAIVRSLCCDHDLIVADEPTGNLDDQTSQDIVSLFQEVAHNQNKCIIIVTHEQDVAKKCDTIYELKNKEFELVNSKRD